MLYICVKCFIFMLNFKHIECWWYSILNYICSNMWILGCENETDVETFFKPRKLLSEKQTTTWKSTNNYKYMDHLASVSRKGLKKNTETAYYFFKFIKISAILGYKCVHSIMHNKNNISQCFSNLFSSQGPSHSFIKYKNTCRCTHSQMHSKLYGRIRIHTGKFSYYYVMAYKTRKLPKISIIEPVSSICL